MQAAVLETFRRPLQITDVPPPEIEPHDVLMKVEACGICHTDLDFCAGAFESLRGDPTPLIPGHQAVGVVAAVGSEVANLRLGDRIASYANFACGSCLFCRAGEEESCIGREREMQGSTIDGGYAEYMRVPASRAVPLPDNIDFVAAAPFLCSGLTVYAAFKNAGIQPGQRVGVIGIGGLGHLALPIAKAMGAEVVAITSSPSKAETARQLGADHVVIGGAGAAQELRALGRLHAVMHTANATAPLAQIYRGLLAQAAVLVVGISPEPVAIPASMIAFMQLRILGSFIGSQSELSEALALASQHGIRPITESYPLAEVNEAHARLRAGKVRYCAVLTP